MRDERVSGVVTLACVRSGWGRHARRAGIALAGGLILVVAGALLVVPVPGTTLLVVPLGLAVLATEFVWAQSLRDRFKAAAAALVRRLVPRAG